MLSPRRGAWRLTPGSYYETPVTVKRLTPPLQRRGDIPFCLDSKFQQNRDKLQRAKQTSVKNAAVSSLYSHVFHALSDVVGLVTEVRLQDGNDRKCCIQEVHQNPADGKMWPWAVPGRTSRCDTVFTWQTFPHENHLNCCTFQQPLNPAPAARASRRSHASAHR